MCHPSTVPGPSTREDARPPSASELLPTVLGDYWFRSREHVSSAVLVRVLVELGVRPDATRAALSRLARRGLLEGRRTGRRTAYRLAPALADAAARQGRRLLAFGAEAVPWDGTWTCVAFSVPDADGHLRARLRARLRALGLGPLYDGLWITPHAPLPALDRCLADLGVPSVTVLRATEVDRPTGTAMVDAWDLVALRRRYDTLTERASSVPTQVDEGAATPAEALVVRTDLMRRWRAAVMADPALPDALLPDDWPLGPARRAFVAAYDALGPLAEERVRLLVAETGAVLAEGPRHHRVADILADVAASAPSD